MCGIVGYVGDKQVVGVILDGLKKLEYRGYDSAGIAVVDERGQPDDSPRRRQAAKSRRSDPAETAGRDLRHRPHAMGDARTAHRRERSSSSRLLRPRGRRSQRHHRELSAAQAASFNPKITPL